MDTKPIPLAVLAALFAAQRAAKPIPERGNFGQEGDKVRYSYANARDTVDTCREALHGAGLAVTLHGVEVVSMDGGRGVVALVGVLFHAESGEAVPVRAEAPFVANRGRPEDKASQAAITTAEARLYRLLLGLTTTEPEVAGGEELDPEPTERKSAPEAKAPPEPTAKPAPAAKAKPAPVEPAAKAKPTAKAKPAAKPATDLPFRVPTDFDVALAERTPSSDEDVEAFKAIAKRLRLSADTAVSFASRVPVGAKLKENPDASWHSYSDAKASGVLGELAAMLDQDLATLKSRKVHPKDGWADAVASWSADLIPY